MRVLIAGGGIAALEALAGLHALAGDRVDTTLLAPEPRFSYRPLSTAVPFTFRDERTRPLAELAEGLGARFVNDALAEVDESRRRVLTRGGDFLPYDALLVAVGARVARPAQPGLTFKRDRAGISAFARVLEELEGGEAKSVAFVVPDSAAWPMDAYELSLIAALAARRGDGRVFLATAEEQPLDAMGRAAGDAVGDELTRAGVELLTRVELNRPDPSEERGLDAFSSAIARLSRRGRAAARGRVVLHLGAGSTLAVDRVVALPAVHGPATAGVPHDLRGFIDVDGHGRVAGSPGVYAAGDATSLLLKHSTLASSQGTAAAQAIAAEAGAEVDPEPAPAVLYGIVALPPHLPGPTGSPWLVGREPTTHCLWWPPGHVAGRYLAPFLAAHDPGLHTGLLWHPRGLPVAAAVGSEPRGEAGPTVARPPEGVIETDARMRQLLAVRRAERQGRRLAHELESEGREFERHEREVRARLEAAGYLRRD